MSKSESAVMKHKTYCKLVRFFSFYDLNLKESDLFFIHILEFKTHHW